MEHTSGNSTVNRALHEIKKLKARIRDLQQHNAMAGTPADTADTGFVLDSGASMHILKRKKWLRRILNRHKVIIRDAAGNTHECDETGPLCMRIRTRDGQYHDLPDMGRGTIMRNTFHNLLSVSELCRKGFTVVCKPDSCEIETPDGVLIPLTERKGLYFIEGEDVRTVTKEYRGLQAETVKVTRLEERRQETAFLGKVGGLDEALFDFELTKSKELDSSLSKGTFTFTAIRLTPGH